MLEKYFMMNALIKKELRSFFTSLTGFFTITIFIIFNGFILWFFEGAWNILDSGLADVSHFFKLVPFIFILLIPALTMRSFSQELQWGTLEILQTKQVSVNTLIFSKFLANLLIVFVMLFFSLSFVYSIAILNFDTKTSIDFGSIFTSYIGVFLVAGCYIAMGLFCSACSKNQRTVLLFSVGICFLFFYGFFAISDSFKGNEYFFQKLSIYWHYQSFEHGVLDTKNILYLLAIIFVFFFGTHWVLKKKCKRKNIFYVFLILYGIYFFGNHFHKRLDCTKDARYTLSDSSIQLFKSIENPILIKVFLEGNFPARFKRLQLETKYLLQEIENTNSKIKFIFENPNKNLKNHIKEGRKPNKFVEQKNGVLIQSLVVPWASIEHAKNSVNVRLLKTISNAKNEEEQIRKSIEHLEYAFVSGLKKMQPKKNKKIAVLVGNGQLKDVNLFDFLNALKPHYRLGKFTLDSVKNAPEKTLEALNTFDLAILAKPTESFSEKEKFVLDQFTIKGGRSLWLIDPVMAHKDSLFSTGQMLAYPLDLGVDDLFFHYGLRLEKKLIKDLYCSKITLSAGNIGNRTNFRNFSWQYDPLIKPNPNHLIGKNIGAVRLQFTSNITLLKNNIKKTVLLESSHLSKKIGLPRFIKLSEVAIPVNPKNYKSNRQNIAVLLEGNFSSAYENRVQPFPLKNALKKGYSKIAIIGDGDIAANQIYKKKPLPLGFDKWTQEFYHNKAFLQNTVDYLLDNLDLIKIRSKTMEFALLNKQKILEERHFWKWFNILLPIALLSFLMGIFVFFHRRRFQIL